MKIFLAFIMAILLYVGLFFLSVLVIWGVGLLFISTFAIDFTFTYPMALVISLIVMIVGSYFKN